MLLSTKGKWISGCNNTFSHNMICTSIHWVQYSTWYNMQQQLSHKLLLPMCFATLIAGRQANKAVLLTTKASILVRCPLWLDWIRHESSEEALTLCCFSIFIIKRYTMDKITGFGEDLLQLLETENFHTCWLIGLLM